MKTKTTRTDLICSECGNVFTIQRKLYSQRAKYHIKDLYCYGCNRITKHIELKDIDMYKEYLNFKENLSVEEVRIKKLILKKEKLNDR